MNTFKVRKDDNLVIITPDGKIVELIIVHTNHKNIKLGFTDNNKVGVYRKELWERIYPHKL